MANTYEAFYFHQFPGRDLELLLGVQWLRDHSLTDGGSPLVLAPDRRAYADHDALVLAERFADSETPRTMARSEWRGGPILAAWPDTNTLELIDGLSRPISAVCVVPWMQRDLAQWRRAHHPIDLTGVPVLLP